MKWTTIECEDDVLPPAREYSVLTYDHKESKLLVFGGWNQGWLDDIYGLAVNKIVGPPYAITDIDPPLGQLSGNVPVRIKGVGFQDGGGIKVYFTASDTRAEVAGKNSI